MKRLSVIAVTKLNDSYPNVKYKLHLLSLIDEFEYSENLFTINNNKLFYSESSSVGLISKLTTICKIIFGHILVLLRYIAQGPDAVYIAYPGIMLAYAISLFPFRRQTEIYLDAFISIYDTVVNDRKLIAPSHWFSKIIFSVERRAFLSAKSVIVDTEENAEFYSQLFGVKKDIFMPIPLSIPPVKEVKPSLDAHAFTCVFVGTFVPLQGTRVIVDAAYSLAERSNIRFVFIGDGQDAVYLEEKLKKTPSQKIVWHRGHFQTEFIVEQLAKADISLGIFGGGNKTQRVLPYKLYYYLAMGMPILTSRTKIIEHLNEKSLVNNARPVFITCEPGSARDLADKIEELAASREKLNEYRAGARDFYESQLSDKVIISKLRRLLLDK